MVRLSRQPVAFLAGIIAFAVVLALTPAARAQVPPLSGLEVMVSLERDGSAVALERLELAAPQLSRDLVWSFRNDVAGLLGSRRTLLVDVLEVSDGMGNRLRYKVRQHGERLEVRIPPQALADSTIRITYDVRNAVRFLRDRDELYWNIGQGWRPQLPQATVYLNLPGAAAGQFSAQAMLRGVMARPVALEPDGTRQQWSIAGPIASGDPLLLDVVLAPGVLKPPSPLIRAGWFLDANPIVLLPVLAFLGMLVFRRIVGGHEEAVSVAPMYEPPAGLTPAEVGVLADGHLDPRDVSATLLDLAVRGYVRIEEGTPDAGVPYSGQDFVLRLLKPMDQWGGLQGHEATLLFHTFYGGKWTKLSSLSLRFYSVVPGVERLVVNELQDKELYSDPRRAQVYRVATTAGLGALLWAGNATGLMPVFRSPQLAVVCIAVALAVVLLMGRGFSHRTLAGARTLAGVRGFQDFMNTVEADRLQRFTPDLFERALPYAVALGVEHHWAQAFGIMTQGPPIWFQPAGGFDPLSFARRIGGFSQATRRVMVARPRGAASDSGFALRDLSAPSAAAQAAAGNSPAPPPGLS